MILELQNKLSLDGYVSEPYICVGQIHSFGLLIKENIEQKVQMLKRLIDGLTVLGIQKPIKLDIGLKN